MLIAVIVIGWLGLMLLVAMTGAIFDLAKAIREGHKDEMNDAGVQLIREATENQRVILTESRAHIAACNENFAKWNAAWTHRDQEMRAHIKWCTERWGDANEPTSRVQ